MTLRAVRHLVTAGAVVIGPVIGLAACGSDSTVTSSPTPSTSKPGATTSSTATESRGPTEWVDVTPEWTSRAPRPFATGPDAVADDLAAAWRGGDTSEVGQISVLAVRPGEPLVVVLRETGGADATVASTDVEITLEGSDEGWVLVSARAQDTCAGTVDSADPTRCA